MLLEGKGTQTTSTHGSDSYRHKSLHNQRQDNQLMKRERERVRNNTKASQLLIGQTFFLTDDKSDTRIGAASFFWCIPLRFFFALQRQCWRKTKWNQLTADQQPSEEFTATGKYSTSNSTTHDMNWCIPITVMTMWRQANSAAPTKMIQGHSWMVLETTPQVVPYI